MSGNPAPQPPAEVLRPERHQPETPRPQPARPEDPRTRRTRDTLGDALMQLLQEQPFDTITVQQVLDRAGVSRTTFYTHFRDKQDLFLSDVEDFLEAMSTLLNRRNAPLTRLVPVEEFFAHVAQVRDFHQALVASGKFADIRELGLGIFARSIEHRLTLAASHANPQPGGPAAPMPPRAASTIPTAIERRATAHALAGALFALLEWWTAHPTWATPAQMDALYHRLASKASG